MPEVIHGNIEKWFRNQSKNRIGREYINETFVARTTALVVVDMQNYFMKAGFLAACPSAIEIVPEINSLANRLRAKGGKVVWIQTTAAPAATKGWSVYKKFYSEENWERRNIELSESHEGYQIWPELILEKQDIYVKKTRFSAFIEGSSDINQQLRLHDIDNVLISGVATNVCCEATARDAMMLNYNTTMISDALAAMTPEAHESSLRAIYGLFTDVQTVSEVIEKLI